MQRLMIAFALAALGACGRIGFDDDTPAFRFRQRIDVRTTRLAADVVDAFPVFVTVKAAAVAQAPTADQLRFVTADGTTPLPFEIEAPRDALSLDAWVRLPELTTSADIAIYAMWGDPTLASASSPRDVFAPPFVGVWHMADGTDSSSRASNGDFTGTTIVEGVASLARDLRGGYLSAPSAGLAGFGADGKGTWSAWVKMASYPALGLTSTAIGLGGEDGGGNDFRFGPSDNASVLGEVTLDPGAQTTYVSGGIVPLATWTQIALVFDWPNLKVFVNGTLESTESVAGETLRVSTTGPLLFGIDCNGCGVGPPNDDLIDGVLDEARIQSVARSEEWFAAEYALLTGALVEVGPVEPL